jgi:translation initiation factor IF-3
VATGRGPATKEAGIRSFVRANQKIRVPKVRCVGPDGSMLGIISTRDALTKAQQVGLDLVEISPNADPPVCRIMDFGKFRYEEAIKEKLARKHQHQQAVKEVKFHASTAEHDYQTKVRHIKEFVVKGHKVKVTLTFRGRENAHKELGFEVMNRVIKDCESVSMVDMPPRMLGRSIISLIGPKSGMVAKPKPVSAAKPASPVTPGTPANVAPVVTQQGVAPLNN